MIIDDEVSEEDLPKVDGMRMCSSACVVNEVQCPFKECKYWINHQGDLNCDLIAINRNGEMTLRQIAERLGVSFVRIKQIEEQALKKLTKRMSIIGQQ